MSDVVDKADAWDAVSDMHKKYTWQPIETAKKTELLDIFSSGIRYVDCYWGKPTYASKDEPYCWVCDDGYDCDGPVANKVPNPTHWMSRPEPPKED